MPAWSEIAEAEPDFARRVRSLFDAGRHKAIATLRADLHRDARFALHGPTFHPEEGNESAWPGEAKIAGRAVPAGPISTEEGSEAPEGEMFDADINEVVVTSLDPTATKLVVGSWTPAHGLRRIERE